VTSSSARRDAAGFGSSFCRTFAAHSLTIVRFKAAKAGGASAARGK
jgi:hypothetical protein